MFLEYETNCRVSEGVSVCVSMCVKKRLHATHLSILLPFPPLSIYPSIRGGHLQYWVRKAVLWCKQQKRKCLPQTALKTTLQVCTAGP